jgi:hypothetical protein
VTSFLASYSGQPSYSGLFSKALRIIPIARPNNSSSVEEDLLGSAVPTASMPCGNGTWSATFSDMFEPVSGSGNTHVTPMSTPTKNIGRGRTPGENPKNLAEAPVRSLKITTNGQIRPLTYYNGNKVGDVRWVAGSFLLSLQKIWDEMGDDILRRVGESHPELLLMAMCKIAAAQRIEVGQPGDFSGLKSKDEIWRRRTVPSVRCGLRSPFSAR